MLLTFRYRSVTFYKKSIESFVCFCDVTLFWVSLCTLLNVLITDQDSNIGLIYLLFEIPFIAYTFIKLLDLKKESLIKINIKNLSKDEDVEIYIQVIKNLIEQKEKDHYRIKLEGFLKYHQKYCYKGDKCPCNELSDNFLSKDDESSEKQIKWFL